EALRELELLLLRRLFLHARAHLDRELVDVDFREQFLDGFGAHLRDEAAGELLHQLPVEVVREQLLLLQIRNVAGIDDDIGLKVKHLLELAKRDVEEVAYARRKPLEKPDVRTRTGQ